MSDARAHRPACRQERPFRRPTMLGFGLLVSFGRHTRTQVPAALGLGSLD